MKAAVIQLNVVKKNKEANLKKTAELIKGSGAELIVLPELFTTGYFFENNKEIEELAEEIPAGGTTKRLVELAKENNCCIVGTIIEKEDEKLFITAVVAGPRGYIGKQRKIHTTGWERKVYSSGTKREIFEVSGVKIGVLVCFEGWFPEAARELMMKGAQVICHSALIMNPVSLEIVKIRAVENRAFVLTANSISEETFMGETLKFRGESRIFDVNGMIIADCGNVEKIAVVEIDEKIAVEKGYGEDCMSLADEIGRYYVPAIKSGVDIFPEIVTKLPEAELGIEGVKANILQGDGQQLLFMQFDKDVELKEHSHKGQMGIVLEGRIDLTIDGNTEIYTKGSRYYIPEGVKHSAKVHEGYADITLFDQKDRYKTKG